MAKFGPRAGRNKRYWPGVHPVRIGASLLSSIDPYLIKTQLNTGRSLTPRHENLALPRDNRIQRRLARWKRRTDWHAA